MSCRWRTRLIGRVEQAVTHIGRRGNWTGTVPVQGELIGAGVAIRSRACHLELAAFAIVSCVRNALRSREVWTRIELTGVDWERCNCQYIAADVGDGVWRDLVVVFAKSEYACHPRVHRLRDRRAG